VFAVEAGTHGLGCAYSRPRVVKIHVEQHLSRFAADSSSRGTTNAREALW